MNSKELSSNENFQKEPEKPIQFQDSLLFCNPSISLRFPKVNLTPDKFPDPTQLLNRRVEVNDSTGIIRYVGILMHQVSGQKDDDLWAGIEWDNPSRGKHNGTVENVEYFKTTSNLNSGSLVKLSKINFGQTFSDAIQFKYNFYSSEQNGLYQFLDKAVENDLYIQANKKRINIELVGKEKAIKKFSDLDKIQSVDLTYSYISDLDINASQLLPKLKELILTRTLINKWSTFAKLLLCFPNLQLLNFSENFPQFDEEYEKLSEQFSASEVEVSIKYLVLNKCKLDFVSLIKLSPMCKTLENLHLMGNDLNEASYQISQNKEYIDANCKILSSNLTNLKVLSLEKNKLKSIPFVFTILSPINLTGLNVNQNHINCIFNVGEIPLVEKVIQNLKSIYIDYNFLTDTNGSQLFRDIAVFENLTDLDILNNSFVNKIGLENVKYELIGRLHGLQTLNNSSIPKNLRKDYEILYLKNSVKEYFNLPMNINLNKDMFAIDSFYKFMQINHPSYFKLVKKYFDPLEDILENMKKSDTHTIKGNTIEVSLMYQGKIIKKNFPKFTPLSQLKPLLYKLFKIKNSERFNFYLIYPDNGGEECLNDESCTLDSIGITDKHTLAMKI